MRNDSIYTLFTPGTAPLLKLLYTYSTIWIILMSSIMALHPEKGFLRGLFFVVLGLNAIHFNSADMDDAFHNVKALKPVLREISIYKKGTYLN